MSNDRGLIFNPGRDGVVMSYYVNLAQQALGGPLDPTSVQRMVFVPPNDGLNEGCPLTLRPDGVFVRVSTGP